RGFKALDKILGHCYLSEYLRGKDGVWICEKWFDRQELKVTPKNSPTILGTVMSECSIDRMWLCRHNKHLVSVRPSIDDCRNK
ncbi:MAG: hypothetical protein ACYS76_13605, partial [Planctomycetota bacterium]